MKKKKRKFGFSLTETMILITILAIAVAASTPIITRKIANITDAGSTLSGGAHGRYEIYTKEIITFGGDSYEKTTDPDFSSSSGILGGGASGSVVVFRRLPDSEYISITAQAPKLHANGIYKSTLYEQIDNAKVHRKPNGEIEYVEFRDPVSNMDRKFPIGGNIIVENADVIYVKGCLDESSTPKNFTKKGNGTCLGTKVVLPNDHNRIIEGNLTDKYNKKHPQTDNYLWHLDANNENNNNGKVTDIPWESVVSGDKTIIDRPIPPTRNPETGEDEYIGTFDPGQNAKNLVVHAVGGGGAGGGISNAGGAITPKTASQNELNEMKITLASRFKEIARSKGINSFNSKSVDQIVKVVDTSNLYKKSYKELFNIDGNSSATDGYYIILNKDDGTITVRVDVRNGLIFPNELLDYTKVLGSPTQQAVIYDMPVWGSFDTIYNNGNGFHAGIVGCGGAGGAGATYTIDSTSIDYTCKKRVHCRLEKKIEDFLGNHCTSYAIDPITKKETGKCVSQHQDWETICYYTCDSPYYSGSVWNKIGHGAKEPCPGVPVADVGGGSCKHTYVGGRGGAAPPCAVACTPVSQPVTNLSRNCQGSGSNGTASPREVKAGGAAVQLTSGLQGKSCTLRAGQYSAISMGGKGGKPCEGSGLQTNQDPQSEMTEAELSQVTNQIAEYIGGDVNMVQTNTSVMVSEEKWSSLYDAAEMFDGINVDLIQSREVNFADQKQTCKAPTCNSSINCGIDGSNGYALNMCSKLDGINTNAQGRYNHIYAWTMPYSINRLTYGEAGEAGEYKSTKISQVVSALKIKLGEGGTWVNDADWKSGKQGPDGTDTVVSMGNKTVLVAKGGKGGKQSQYTNKYDLCYAKPGVCTLGSKTTNCCESEKGTRSTKDILVTAGKMSAFENIKALVGNSLIIGTGLGRGGDGAGTRAGVEENYDKRYFLNASGYNVSYPTSSVFQPPQNEFATGSASVNDYHNTPLKPSQMNFKGGDGAVIITW